MARELDLVAMHAYGIYSPLALGPLDESFVLYVQALTDALAGHPLKASAASPSQSQPLLA